ncbi:MAG: M24 family metallopeptidase [Blastocatellia bacterium]
MTDKKRLDELRSDFARVERVLAETPAVDKFFAIPTEEFVGRQQRTLEALRRHGLEVGLVFSDEHYDGDVPYLGGNTNIQIEQVAGVIGRNGFHIVAGLEGGYVAEQLAPRAGARVAKVEMLKLAGEEYPIHADRLEDVIEAAAGEKVRRIGLLTAREVVPAAIVQYLERLFGPENVIDCQESYFRLKYEKSDNEMRLIRDASVIADAVMRAMLAVLRPGMLETQVAAWGYFVARELGAEELGWDLMVGANTANRTLIGKALNRVIHEGDYVHLGVAPKRDGLNSCLRRSCVAVGDPSQVTKEQRFWFALVEKAYEAGITALRDVAANDRPAGLVEQAVVDYLKSREDEVSRRLGRKIQLDRLKPYSSAHNAGYTECQEFYGAVTLHSGEPLGDRIVVMLDVALRGIGDAWDDVIVPGMDFVVVENTCGKFGPRLEEFSALPWNVQGLVGNGLGGNER